MGGKYSIQARQYSLKFGTSIHTCAKQTPGEQSPLPIPAGTSIATFTHKVPRQKRAGLGAQIVRRKHIPCFKNSNSSGRGNKNLQQAEKGVKLSFWGEGTNSRATASQNLWTLWWRASLQEGDGTCTSCPAPSWSNRHRSWLYTVCTTTSS